MHITLEADYAIRIIIELARVGCRQDAKIISENTDVSLRFALKILRKFVAGGILKSYKGTQGGYELARSAEDITLKDVLEITQGNYFISRCLVPEHCCPRNDRCKVHTVFERISRDVQHQLASVSIASLL